MVNPVEHLIKLQEAGASLSDLLSESCRLANDLIQEDIDRTQKTGAISNFNRPEVRALFQHMHDMAATELIILNAKIGPQS